MPGTTQSMELAMALSSLHSQLNKKLDLSLGVLGISFTEFLVLHHLNAAPGKTMRRIDLAESVGLSASGVTRLLSPMEKTGLVQKEPNPRDARVSLVKLSRAGGQVLKDATTSMNSCTNGFFQALDAKKLARLFDLIKVLA